MQGSLESKLMPPFLARLRCEHCECQCGEQSQGHCIDLWMGMGLSKSQVVIKHQATAPQSHLQHLKTDEKRDQQEAEERLTQSFISSTRHFEGAFFLSIATSCQSICLFCL